jgi:transcriptional regulator with XRE-family HTH domain
LDTIGERLIYLLNRNNLTPSDFARGINASTGNVGDWLAGRSKPGSKALLKISKFFDVSQEWLLEGKDDTPDYARSGDPENRPGFDPFVEEVLKNDPELQEFWKAMIEREDLRILFKKSRPLKPSTVKQIIAWIKAVEDAEAEEENRP